MRLVSNRRLDLLRHLHNLLDSERRGKKLLPLQSDIAASVLIVLFHALGLGSRERRGRTRPQKGESQHNTSTTLVLHVCASWRWLVSSQTKGVFGPPVVCGLLALLSLT
jgi:hypothetical protein